MKKTIKPGQLITFEHVVYRAKRARFPAFICGKCDLQKLCSGYKRKFNCDWNIYFKRL